MILLAHSNFLSRDSKQLVRMKPYSPLSTLIAAALLRREGHDVAVYDATFEPGIETFEAMLDRTRPDALLLIEDNFNFLTKMCTTARRESALAMAPLTTPTCTIPPRAPSRLQAI